MPYHKITITSISKKAGVPRSTFYRYYDTKEDVLKDYIQYFFEVFSYKLKQYHHITIKNYIQFHFLFFKENEIYFQTLKKLHYEYIFFDYISNPQLYSHYQGDDKNYVIYQTISLLSIIFNWVTSQNQLSISYMSEMVMSLLSEDLMKKILPIFLTVHTKLSQ